MVSSISDLSEFRKKKEEKLQNDSMESHRNKFQETIDSIFLQWDVAASMGLLTQFLAPKLGVGAGDVYDLNVISKLERSLGMEVAIFYPRALPHNPNGFVAGFNHEKYAMATPEMDSEVLARILNILLYIETTEIEKAGIL